MLYTVTLNMIIVHSDYSEDDEDEVYLDNDELLLWVTKIEAVSEAKVYLKLYENIKQQKIYLGSIVDSLNRYDLGTNRYTLEYVEENLLHILAYNAGLHAEELNNDFPITVKVL